MSEDTNQLLQQVIEQGYEEACHYWKVIAYRKPVFKGFYNQEIYQEILNNQEILDNLKLNTPKRKEYFKEELQNLILTKAGMTLPAKWEVWIIINPFYLNVEPSQRLALDFVETVAHEVAHAVIFNWDVWWGHVEPHAEIASYLQNYYLQNLYVDWEKLLKRAKR